MSDFFYSRNIFVAVSGEGPGTRQGKALAVARLADLLGPALSKLVRSRSVSQVQNAFLYKTEHAESTNCLAVVGEALTDKPIVCLVSDSALAHGA